MADIHIDALRVNPKVQRLITRGVVPLRRFATGNDGTLVQVDHPNLGALRPYSVDPFTSSCLREDITDLGEPVDWKPLGDITTRHTYGYVLCFKPSVAEVLAAIPEELVEKVRGFTVQYAGPSGEHVGDVHIGKATLYA